MAPERAPAFQFYPKDFLMDGNVAEMSLQERGAYITLLCLCWLDFTLPSDPKRLANMVGIPTHAFLKLWPAVGKCFRDHEGRLVHPRLDKERVKQAEFRRRQSDKGIKGAAARWPDDGRGYGTGNTGGMAQAIPNHSSPISDLPSPKKKHPSGVGRPKAPADPRVKEFLAWFQSEYATRRNGAPYLVKWDKHGALVKQMLGAVDLEPLKIYAQIMLSDKCEDGFIIDSDRGIEVLNGKFNWLAERYAAWQKRRTS